MGSNCDRDIQKALKALDIPSEFLWGEDSFSHCNFSAFILPGGFSYGDYLRPGALASLSPSLKSLKVASEKGYPILGICNGFQILCEAGFLENSLLENESGKFIDKDVKLKLNSSSSFWGGDSIQETQLPIAHKQGRFFCNEDLFKRIQDEGRIWLTYEDNPNGSLGSVAGVLNKNKNVAGLMPHPERAMFPWAHGSEDGAFYFQSLKGI